MLCLQFVDNEQSLLVSDAHLDNDLPEAMKTVLHLAGEEGGGLSTLVGGGPSHDDCMTGHTH